MVAQTPPARELPLHGPMLATWDAKKLAASHDIYICIRDFHIPMTAEYETVWSVRSPKV